jgi:hypothetical protein
VSELLLRLGEVDEVVEVGVAFKCGVVLCTWWYLDYRSGYSKTIL